MPSRHPVGRSLATSRVARRLLEDGRAPLILEIGTRILAAFFELSDTLVGYEVTVRMFSDTWPDAFSRARNGAEKS